MRKFIKAMMDSTVMHWVVSIVYGFIDFVYYIVAGITLLNTREPYWKDWRVPKEPKWPLPPLHRDVPIPPSLADSCGMYLATFVVDYVDANKLAPLLPSNLEFDRNRITKEGKHPVIYIFGYADSLHPGWLPLPCLRYMEFAVCIPTVRLKIEGDSYTGPFFYLPRLHLDRLYPTMLGWGVGYKKVWSRMSSTEDTYSISTLLAGTPLLKAEFIPDGEVSDPPRDEKLVRWQSLLAQPHANTYFFHTMLYLQFHWAWNLSKFQSVNAKVQVFTDDIPGLPKGNYEWPPLDMTEWKGPEAPIGAFRALMPYELLFPFSRKSLDPIFKKLIPAWPPKA